MRTVRTGLFTSLDGIVDADDDWQFSYFDEELMREIFGGFDGADDLLMGRVSYEGYACLRTEHPDSPVLPLLDARPKHVASTTPADEDLDREGATIIGGDVAAGTMRSSDRRAATSCTTLSSGAVMRFSSCTEW